MADGTFKIDAGTSSFLWLKAVADGSFDVAAADDSGAPAMALTITKEQAAELCQWLLGRAERKR